MFTLIQRKIVFIGLLLATGIQSASAFGIDKLFLNVDRAADFSSVSDVVIFNGNDEVVYVTGRTVAWDNDVLGSILTSPTRELAISPPVARIPAKGTATFNVKYVGPKRDGESTYRAVFNEIRVPVIQTGAEVFDKPTPKISAGFVMTIPVYVSDFSEKGLSFKNVTATVHRTEKGASIIVKNGGTVHAIVESVRQGTAQIKNYHSTVLTKRELQLVALESFDFSKPIQVELSYGDDKQLIDVLAEK